jgi:DNA-binding CsgD family transcriptional regulator
LLNGINDGMTNQQMADKFFISINTVKYHLKNLFLKMDVPSRTAAIVKFREIDTKS